MFTLSQTQKIARSLAALPLLLAFASGCDNPLAVEDAADHATQELGLPVMIWAVPQDRCANAQMMALAADYQSMGSSEKSSFKKSLSPTYDAVIVQGTKEIGRIEGEKVQLNLVRKKKSANPKALSHGEARLEPVASKVISDQRTRTFQGSVPPTSIEKGRELRVTPNAVVDQSAHTTYQTSNSQLYEAVVSGKTSIADAVKTGELTDISSTNTQFDDECSAVAHIKNL